MSELPYITVHGRFQPPLHINHWEYVKQGFDRAEHVTILITNPDRNEVHDELASWRSDMASNPFTFDERVKMFTDFFTLMEISPECYDFVPFNIQDASAFNKLNPTVPNLVNVYSEWSAKKLDLFEEQGLKVIKLEQPKSEPVSGTIIRNIITNTRDHEQLPDTLVEAGFMPQAIPGLLAVLNDRKLQV